MWIRVATIIVVILTLFPYVMVHAEDVHSDGSDESIVSTIENESDSSSASETSSIDPSEENTDKEISEPDNSESSEAENESSAVKDESALEESEVESEEDESNGTIAYIKPISTSGISLFATSISVGSFPALQTAVQNADTDIEVVFTANVVFSGTIEIKAGKK